MKIQKYINIMIVSIIVTILLFIAHALPINENIIEPNITNAIKENNTIKKNIAYVIAYLYYLLVIFIGLSIINSFLYII